jgi:tetratricopeptide (TPR) repeat protein
MAAPKKAQKKSKSTAPVVSNTLPVTSKSEPAKALFEQGVAYYENLKLTEALDKWRQAVKLDPDFALAHCFIFRVTLDPAEQLGELQRAKAAAANATPQEQLFIRWFADSQENKFINAITAMNDLLAQLPKDKRLRYYASSWLLTHGSNERSVELGQEALALDPNYPAALNELAYAYAMLGQMNDALTNMERYVSLLPNEVNPHDSFAELMRMDGKFSQALEHYRSALRIDPSFDSSQVGIADTYLLMGEYDQAREAYAVAIKMAPDAATRLQYRARIPQTYVREAKWEQADKAFEGVIAEAHSLGIGGLEASALRDMALFQKDDSRAFALLERAETALNEHEITGATRAIETAYILRDRVIRAAACNNQEVRGGALARLNAMAETDRRDLVQQAYHLATGASLIMEKKNGEAIEHLYENSTNPRALALLATAFQNMKAASEAASVRQKLARFYEPTMEQAVATARLRN